MTERDVLFDATATMLSANLPEVGLYERTLLATKLTEGLAVVVRAMLDEQRKSLQGANAAKKRWSQPPTDGESVQVARPVEQARRGRKPRVVGTLTAEAGQQLTLPEVLPASTETIPVPLPPPLPPAPTAEKPPASPFG